MAAVVADNQHADRVFDPTVQHRVGEAVHEATPDVVLDNRIQRGVGENTCNGREHLGPKLFAETSALLVVEDDCVIENPRR